MGTALVSQLAKQSFLVISTIQHVCWNARISLRPGVAPLLACFRDIVTAFLLAIRDIWHTVRRVLLQSDVLL